MISNVTTIIIHQTITLIPGSQTRKFLVDTKNISLQGLPHPVPKEVRKLKHIIFLHLRICSTTIER